MHTEWHVTITCTLCGGVTANLSCWSAGFGGPRPACSHSVLPPGPPWQSSAAVGGGREGGRERRGRGGVRERERREKEGGRGREGERERDEGRGREGGRGREREGERESERESTREKYFKWEGL